MPAKKQVKRTARKQQLERIRANALRVAKKTADRELRKAEEKNLLGFLRAFGINANVVKSKKRSKNSVIVVIATSPFVRHTFQIDRSDVLGKTVSIKPIGKRVGTKKEQQQILFALQHPKATQEMLPQLKTKLKRINSQTKVVKKSTSPKKASAKLKGKKVVLRK